MPVAMTCANCGKPIKGTSPVSEGGRIFCNNICRLAWRKRGGDQVAVRTPEEPAVGSPEFPIEPPGFEGRGMRLRLSIWKRPKLFVDGRLQAPARSGFLGRRCEYRAINDAGKEVVIRLRFRPLDQIPVLEIDGTEYPIARPLRSWEYVWMSLPALLLFMGGALGGVIGVSALFANSIMMRRIRNPVARYGFTGLTTALAWLMFTQSLTVVRPLFDQLGLGGRSIDAQIEAVAAELSRHCPVTIDKETRLDSSTSRPGRILIYHYTLMNVTAGQLNTEALKQQLRPAIIAAIRTKEEMRMLRENGVTFVYRYNDRDGHTALQLQISPEEYR